MQVTVTRPGDLGPGEITAWRSLQSQTGSLANPFLCPEFTIAVGAVNPRARVAVLTDGPRVAGFFPFERRPSGAGTAIAAGLTDGQGLIHAPGAEWDARELLRACHLPTWRFDHLVEGQQPFARYAEAVAPSPVIDLSGGYPDYAAQLRARSPRFFADLGRKARKLEREGGALHFQPDSRDPAELRMLMDWKSGQYRRNGWVDLFARPWVVDLIDQLFSTHTGTFDGLLSVLYVGDKPAAAHFGLRAGPMLAHWFPAYDPAFGRWSPGLIQHVQMAEQTAALGVQLIDMGTGTERYKQTLRSRDLLVAEGTVTRGPAAAATYRVSRTASRWARGQVRRHPWLFRPAEATLRRLGRIG